MIQKITNYLREPYPFLYRNQQLILSILGIIAVASFLFSYAFEPFEINTAEHKIPHVWILVVHAVLPVPIVFLYFLLVNWRVKDDARWTIGKEMLHLSIALILIGIGSFLVRDVIYDNPNNWSFRYFYEEIRNSVLVGVLLLAIILPLNLQRLIQKHSKNLEKLSFSAEESQKIVQTMQIQAGNEHFQFTIQDFLFAKVESNYTEIFLNDTDGVSKTLVRITLKELETRLQEFPNIYKSHRSYLINLDKITSCKGNAQGYQLSLQNYSETVPVSRSKLKEFDAYFLK
ncbi:putative two-component response-regulatory protein YehT [Kordia sp. SMS9]|uniref:LytR/AlgR family response regulator transcription factor n=1 Tax=Kordia sp. SMS9 TaxID=2282170 RepID=UPI000E0CC661|nr:LytTR family DNA-binding domain-containing protein [Kordia sp. SMS9]AXG71302.1 putative two-component response-regulatory protein YehT [Kordia sp. SMS9]